MEKLDPLSRLTSWAAPSEPVWVQEAGSHLTLQKRTGHTRHTKGVGLFSRHREVNGWS